MKYKLKSEAICPKRLSQEIFEATGNGDGSHAKALQALKQAEADLTAALELLELVEIYLTPTPIIKKLVTAFLKQFKP